MKVIIERTIREDGKTLGIKSEMLNVKVELKYNEHDYSLWINEKLIEKDDKMVLTQKLNSIDRRLEKIIEDFVQFDLEEEED